MYKSPGENGLNGGPGFTNRERILDLHKRLHNEKTDEYVMNNDQPVKEFERTSKIRRADVRKYLGEPLPLPYLANSRTQRIGQDQVTPDPNVNRREIRPRQPLGKDLTDQEMVYKDRLRNSLKKFQKSSERNKKLIDKVVQTEEPTFPVTPNHKKSDDFGSRSQFEGLSPIKGESPSRIGNKILLENSNDKDLILHKFKLKNYSRLKDQTPLNSSQNPDDGFQYRKELLEPFEPSNGKQIFKRSKIKKEYIHIRLISVLGSPLLFSGLLFLLYYTLKDFLRYEFISPP